MDDKQQYRTMWQSYIEAKQRGDEKGVTRAVRALAKLAHSNLDAIDKEMSRQVEQTIDKIWEGKKQPNLAKCVLAMMNELRDIGLWDGEKRNSTYILTTHALDDYGKAERERVKYLTAKKAYEKANRNYLVSLGSLAMNLIFKGLSPLQTDTRDPLMWYLPGAELIKVCKNNGVELTFPTIRKYQRLGLIPKPIRLGRKAHYSGLTIFRLLWIDELKKKGETLSYIKGVLDDYLKIQQDIFKDIFLHDRNWWQDASVAMTFLTDSAAEELLQMIFEGDARILGKNIK